MTLVAACGPKAAVQDAPVWELRGRVEAISASQLDVRHKSGRVIALQVDSRTEFVDRDGNGSSRDVARGMRVAVRVETTATGYRARRVRVFD
jgi:hypothetical protein